jgi:hypothetical protein
MTDDAVNPRSNALAEIIILISTSFSAGVFLVSSMSYFARGGEPLAWIDAGVVVFMVMAALFMARRIWRKIPGERR